jgi:hypothetical protein
VFNKNRADLFACPAGGACPKFGWFNHGTVETGYKILCGSGMVCSAIIFEVSKKLKD